MDDLNVAKVLVLGRTGVGKSSFINYLLNSDSAEVGVGKPVTQGKFSRYNYQDENGMRIDIVDTKGIEVKDASEYVPELTNDIIENCNNDDPTKWYHSIFYCVSMNNKRFEPFEIDFINDLSKDINQNIHILLTHYKEKEHEKSKEMEKYILSELDEDIKDNIKFYRVCSVNKKTRGGEIKQYGREQIVDSIFETFFKDVAKKVSRQYANEAHKIYEDIINKFKNDFIEFIEDNVSPLKIKDFDNGVMYRKQYEMTELIKERYSYELFNLKPKYNRSIKPVQDIYNSYKNILNSTNVADVNLDYIFDDLYPFDEEMFDIYEVLEKSELGSQLTKLEIIKNKEALRFKHMDVKKKIKFKAEKNILAIQTKIKILSIKKEIIGTVEDMFVEQQEKFNKSSVETKMFNLLCDRLINEQSRIS